MYRIRTTLTGVQGSPWLSTMYFDVAGGTAQDAADAVGVFWGAMDNSMVSAVQWATEAEVAQVNASNGNLVMVHATTPVTGVGASATEVMPIATQGLVRWRTGSIANGREVRGRTFIPGLVEANNNSGVPTAAFVTMLNGAASALISDANSVLVVYHRGDPDAGSPGSKHTVTTGTAWSQFAVLRSRRD